MKRSYTRMFGQYRRELDRLCGLVGRNGNDAVASEPAFPRGTWERFARLGTGISLTPTLGVGVTSWALPRRRIAGAPRPNQTVFSDLALGSILVRMVSLMKRTERFRLIRTLATI